MKAQCCDTSNIYDQINKQLLEKIDQKIMAVFQQIKAHRYAKMEEFYDLLLKRKNVGGLQNSFKEKFYRQQEIQQFNFIKNLDLFTLKVLRLIKCQLKDFKIDWKQIMNKLESSDKSTNKVTRLHTFLKLIRDYYDQNNAMDVFKHFLGKYNLGDEMIWIYMEYFINITKNTKPQIASELLVRLKQIHKYQDVKELCYYRWLLKIKRKIPQILLEGTYLDELNHSILNELTLLQSKGKGSIGGTLTSKFLTNVFAKFIGKTNPKSVQMINWLFKIFESGVSAFEDKKTALKVLRNFLKPFWARKTLQDRLRKKLQKKDNQDDDEEDKKDKDKQKDKDKDNGQRSDLTDLLDSLGTLILQDSDDDEQENQIDETLPVEQKQKLRQQRLSQLQADELTPQIMNALKTNIQVILQDIFFTPSKQVSNLLKYIYFLFPDLAQKSIQFLSKGMDITEMNFSIHMKNTKKIVQYLLVFGDRQKLMDNILTIISEISKIRYVKQAWHVLSYIIMKIPCLDQQDYKKVPESVKDNFQKNFKMSHDVFYEKYSELMFQLFKKFIKQIQVKQKKSISLQDNPFLGFAYNVYPEFQKRILELAISNYIQTPNSFIFNYLELKKIPQKHIESFIPQLKTNLTNQKLKNVFGELLIASRNLPFDRLSKIIYQVSNYQSNSRVSLLLDMVRVYFQQNIWMLPVYKPLQSSLEYLWNSQVKYEISVKNNNKQQVEDSLRTIYNLWNQNYQILLQFIKEHSKSFQQKIDAVQIIKKFYFTVRDPDFQLRKHLLSKLDIIDSIVDSLPGQNLVWTQASTLKDLHFKQFKVIKEIKEKTLKLIQDLFHIIYIQFPHEHKILNKLSSIGILLATNMLQNSDKFIEEYKDVMKVLRANESKNHINYFLIVMKEAQRYLSYSSVDYELNNQKANNKLTELVELALLHPDQNAGMGPFSKAQDYDMTGLLLELLKMTPPPNAQPNRLKLFHQNLSNVLHRQFSKPRNIIPTRNLLQIMALVITHITSSQKSVRQGYLSALKRLLELIEDVRIDEKALDVITDGLSTTSSKQKLIWATGLVFLEDNIINFGKFYDMLNQLLFSDDFLIRKYSQFLLSYLIRSDRKKHSKQTIVKDLGEYKEKTLDQFLETGYLRPEHIDSNIKFKKILMRYRGYYSCALKEKRIDKQALSFIFDQEKALKFLKQYQTDQVSSQDELKLKKKASLSSQFSQLSDIFTWLKSKYSKLLDISEHKFTSYQSIFGQRFFKYIFQTDYHHGFPFFLATKDFIETVCIPNLQTLDNQVVVLNYLSTLLGAYSKFHRTIKSQEVESFILRATGEIIQKSSGQFFTFFKKLSLLHIDELPLIVNFFEKYPPTHPNFYRTVQIRLIWFSHKRQQLQKILSDIFKAGKNLQNANVSKLLKLIITFNQTHYFHKQQINQCKILNLKQLQQKNDIVQQTDNIYTAHRKQLDDILHKNLTQLINSQKLEDRKSGNDLLNSAIAAYCFLQKTQVNIKSLNIFLNMAVDIVVNNKEEFSNQQDPIEDTIVIILSSVYPQKTFPIILQSLKKLLVPLPKVINYLNKLVKYPYNFLRMSQENYQSFIAKLLSLLENNLNFKQLLTTISSFLYFRKLRQQDISKICSNPRAITTYHMAVLLSDVRNLAKYQKELQKVLNSKEKDKIKIWATIMINSRGKRQILEDQETHQLWRSIKDVSNPYFYHC